MMKALIIEDSRLAREELKSMLVAIPDIDVIGEAPNHEVALEIIAAENPGLLFLDIHLPGKNGFELLEQLDAVPPVIFTTAYDEYAIQSFEYNAIDYLLKPIRQERLQKAVEKARKNFTPKQQQEKLGEQSQVFVKDGERCWFVTLGEVRLFESHGNYTRLYFGNNRPLILKSLNYLESVLDSRVFFRINRSQIINLRQVAGIADWFQGRLRLRMKDGTEVDVSRRQAAKIRELFSF